ncbi:hypothetical protein BBJ28_00020510 [Nothophytophthora sp. Chile5]|nr:hypothetical protein BBJ28_00020510 [Nothophytophthora sp. Chile5]
MQPHRSDNNHKSRTVSEAPPSQDDISQDPLPLAKTQPTAATGKKTRSKKITRKSMKTQQRTGKSIRRKSPGTVMENKFKKGKGYCSVVCRLESICSDSLLYDEIKRTAHAMKQIQLEAWHLNPDLWNSIKIYQTQREEAGLREISNLTGYSTLKAQLRQQMIVNAGVMIREHFYKRLRLYVNIAFGGVTTRDMTKQQKNERNERLRSIMKTCFSTDTTDDPGAQHMRTMLTPESCAWGEKLFPYSNRIKENGLEFYVRLLYKFQQKVNERMKEVPNEKGVRAFSLFPVSTSYVGGHITINASTLSGFYSRIKRVENWRLLLISSFISTEPMDSHAQRVQHRVVRNVIMRGSREARECVPLQTRSPSLEAGVGGNHHRRPAPRASDDSGAQTGCTA